MKEKGGVVHAKVSFLSELDLLDNYKLYVNNVENVLCCASLIIKIQLQRKHGHIYLSCNKGSTVLLYTRPVLLKLYNTFSHPASDNLEISQD